MRETHHQRLRALRKAVTLNRRIDDMARVMLAELDAETRFKLRSPRRAGRVERGLEKPQ